MQSRWEPSPMYGPRFKGTGMLSFPEHSSADAVLLALDCCHQHVALIGTETKLPYPWPTESGTRQWSGH